MKVSARNVVPGVITAIEPGAVNTELQVEIAPGVAISSIITKKSCDNLGLAEGKRAYVVIKASNVMIGVDD